MRRTFLFSILVAVIVSVDAGRTSAQVPAPAPNPDPASPAIADVVVVDRDGRFVDGLRSGDFTVTVDGVRRPVRWVRRVSRGPGAVPDAASRQTAAEEGLAYGAEAARNVLVLIDQGSMARGDERAAMDAARLFLDRLGLEDRVAVLTFPIVGEAKIAMSTDRADTRQALSRVVGQRAAGVEGLPAQPPAPPVSQPDTIASLNPDEPSRQAAPVEAREETKDKIPGDAGSLMALRALFESFRTLPGRKVVALFSAGLPTDAGPLVDAAAAAAVDARVTVMTFGVRSPGADTVGLGTGPLDRLASATGGSFVQVGKNADRSVDRVVRELSACYVLGLEPAAQAVRGGRRPMRIETARKGVTVRAASWLAGVEDTGDRLPESARARPAGLRELVAEAAAAPEAAPVHDPELDLALARMFEYAEAYERQYAMLVAEEDYKQSAPKGSVHLRSDLLLVRPAANEQWVSFRDVFEVDGRPVRDREDRLRRLFLEGTPEAMARMEAITQEGARYNIGIVGRTVNVPLLPLTFLRRENRGRFEYRSDGRSESGGVEVLKIRYTEWARPTLVGDGNFGDQPVSGWFLVDAITGAIVETRMEGRREEASGEITVRYRRDADLGLWVPAEMKELYSLGGMTRTGSWGMVRETISGRATYSNFRRFQVTTEEKIKPPK